MQAQPAFVNQYGQPCDSQGNPLLPAQPAQQQIVYMPAGAGQPMMGQPMMMAQPQPMMSAQPAMMMMPPQQQHQPAMVMIPPQQQQQPNMMAAMNAAAAASAAAKPVSAKDAVASASSPAIVSALAKEFKNGRTLCLTSSASKKTLRITDQKGTIEGLGAFGEFAQWMVHVTVGGAEPRIKLQSKKFPQHYLRIDENKHLNGNGTGGELTEFSVVVHDDQTISLRSVHHFQKGNAYHVGILEDGKPKDPTQTGTGVHGRFKCTWK